MRAIMGQIAETSGVVAAIERDLEHNAAETARLEMLKSSFIQVRAKLEKVQAAHEEASAEHKALLQELRDVERLIALEEAGRTDQFQTIDPAELDAARFPVSPKRPMLLAAALAGAIAAGVGAAYLLELLRPAYRDPADLEADLHIDVLAALPEAPEGAGDALSGARRAPAEAAT
jgi:capsular polysaccharide biosynthesis protein